jgi:hypothetical protein
MTQVSCPSCGATIQFKLGSSIVMVCPYCRSVVARTDRSVEDLGKVSDLVDTGTPLSVGLKGKYKGQYFELTGRAQLGHPAGGMWDEWYVSFGEGHLGWLAEAQGHFYLTYERPGEAAQGVPPFNSLGLGQPVSGLGTKETFVVSEKASARAIAAQGEIPWLLKPGDEYYYADISAPDGKFGTIDYSSNPPVVFLGHEVTLDDLGVAGIPHQQQERHAASAALPCPNCGGPLALRAPDKSERVVCPNCDSLLDINQGKLVFLKALNQRKVEPKLPLGSIGKLYNADYTVIGFTQRSVHFDKDYFWQEYLIYNPQIGFRWLVDSDDHWNFVQPVTPGDIKESGRNITFRGKSFRKYQDAAAKVVYVAGEFYWKVVAGETVQAVDYISPPEMISKEVSKSANKYEEVNYSLGTYIEVSEIEKAFNVKGLRRPTTVAPNQINPHKGIGKFWLLFMAILMFVAIATSVIRSPKDVLSNNYQLQPLPSADGTQVIFSDKFQLLSGRNIRVKGVSGVDNSWIYAEGDLINEETGLVQSFSMPIEYYHGVEDGESWTEGSQTKEVYLSALPAGTYTLRLETSWEKWQQPAAITISMEQGSIHGLNFLLAFIALLIFPVLGWIRRLSFERRRWADSDFSPYSTSS